MLIACAALGCLWYAATPWRFSAAKKSQLEHDVASFIEETESVRQRTEYIRREAAEDPAEEPEEIPYAELRQDMELYNLRIFRQHQTELSSRASYSEEGAGFDLVAYGLSSNIFGVLKIPKMDLEMPLYLGASYPNLADGAAVLAQTSIPIGGSNTNAVIAGHRGWNGFPYFMNIESLEPGDYVFVTNPWETLTYKVVEIKIIIPSDIDAILIQPGRDLITLLTCHPPNSGGRYRYLVFCERNCGDETLPAAEMEE